MLLSRAAARTLSLLPLLLLAADPTFGAVAAAASQERARSAGFDRALELLEHGGRPEVAGDAIAMVALGQVDRSGVAVPLATLAAARDRFEDAAVLLERWHAIAEAQPKTRLKKKGGAASAEPRALSLATVRAAAAAAACGVVQQLARRAHPHLLPAPAGRRRQVAAALLHTIETAEGNVDLPGSWLGEVCRIAARLAQTAAAGRSLHTLAAAKLLGAGLIRCPSAVWRAGAAAVLGHGLELAESLSVEQADRSAVLHELAKVQGCTGQLDAALATARRALQLLPEGDDDGGRDGGGGMSSDRSVFVGMEVGLLLRANRSAEARLVYMAATEFASKTHRHAVAKAYAAGAFAAGTPRRGVSPGARIDPLVPASPPAPAPLGRGGWRWDEDEEGSGPYPCEVAVEMAGNISKKRFFRQCEHSQSPATPFLSPLKTHDRA